MIGRIHGENMARKQARFGQPAVYNETAPTLTDGEDSALNVDESGNLKQSLATKLAGEDIPNDVMKVEERFNYAPISSAATTIIKASPGFLHSITIAGGTLGAITVYDNTTGSGTTIVATFTPTAAVPCPPMILDVSFATGLTIVTAAATVITVSYR